jgi:hypothetical protein
MIRRILVQASPRWEAFSFVYKELTERTENGSNCRRFDRKLGRRWRVKSKGSREALFEQGLMGDRDVPFPRNGPQD